MKGVSTIIVTILIVIIVVAIIGLTYTFSVTLFSQAAGGAQNQTRTVVKSLGMQARIDSVSGNEVFIRNTGFEAITQENLGVFVNDIKVDFVLKPANLNPGQIGSMKLKNLEDLISSEGDVNLRLSIGTAPLTQKIKSQILRNFVGYGKIFYFYTIPTTNIAVFAKEDNIEVLLIFDNTVQNSFIINTGSFNTFSSLPNDKHVLIKANGSVAAMAYSYCCGWNNFALTTVSAADTQNAIGKLFYAYSGNFKIISYGNNNQITVTHSAGTTSVNLNDGQTYANVFNSVSNTTGPAIKIESTQLIVVIQGGDNGNDGTYVPSDLGIFKGNKFRGRTNAFITIVSYEDGNSITAKNLIDGSTIGSWTLNKNQFQRVSFNGWYEATSSKPISTMSDSPELCNAGDDTYAIGGMDNIIYWVGSRTLGVSLFDQTINVDGTPVTLNKNAGALITSTEGVHEITSSKPLLLVAYSSQSLCTDWSWNDWHTFLPSYEVKLTRL